VQVLDDIVGGNKDIGKDKSARTQTVKIVKNMAGLMRKCEDLFKHMAVLGGSNGDAADARALYYNDVGDEYPRPLHKPWQDLKKLIGPNSTLMKAVKALALGLGLGLGLSAGLGLAGVCGRFGHLV
jgi:hypothetical protein